MSEKKLISALRNSIIDRDEEEAKKIAIKIVENKIDPVKAIEEGVASAAKIVGDKFENEEFFLGDLMLAGEAMESSSKILVESLSKEKRDLFESQRVGTAITATVQGDIHDIGKNILQLMMTVNGFKVTDLGRDVDSMEIVEKAKELNVDIIALSALMSTTMQNQKEIIDILKSLNIRNNFIVLVGGGSTSKEWADKIEADGWADTATEAVALAKKLVEKKRGK